MHPVTTTAGHEYTQKRYQSEQKVVPAIVYPTRCDLSIIIPTRNEQDNISPLIDVMSRVLDDLYVEIIFVDDSDDDTR